MRCCTIFVLIIEKATVGDIDDSQSLEEKTVVKFNGRLSVSCRDIIKLGSMLAYFSLH